MAVNFVIGRAGSGKTRHCARRIAHALAKQPLGSRIYWLLPKQATFIAERELACGMGLPGFCRARVMSFEQFAVDVFNDCGGSSIPQITPMGRQMALGHLLRKHEKELRFFRSVARQPGLAAELDATLAELERCGRDPGDILNALKNGDRPAGDAETIALLDKLTDLDLLSTLYGEFLGQDRLDQHRRLDEVLKSIGTCSFMADAAFYVDGFSEFTDFERKMLVGIGKSAASLDITLTIDPASPTVRNPLAPPSEMSVFHRTEQTYRRLRSAFAAANVPVDVALLGDPARFKSPAIGAIEKFAFAPVAGVADAGNAGVSDPGYSAVGLTLLEAPSRAAEVNAAAREIARLVAEEKLRYRDIAVMVRSTEPYLGLIDAAFAEHRIPWFADRRRLAGHHPLLQLMRAVFQIVRFDWPHDAVMAMLKGGLAGVDAASADEIENYCLRFGLVGSAWTSPEPWRYQQRLLKPEDAEDSAIPASADNTSIDALRRRLVAAIEPFAAALAEPDLTVRRIASGTFACLERLGARQELQRWMESATAAGKIEQAGEHEQVWAELVELFEQMVELLGDEPMRVDDFVVVLESGLAQFDLALAPATVDQVLIGQVDRTHAPAIKACLVLGLSNGEFPAVVRDPTVLSDRERRSLSKQQIELSPDTHRKQLDESFLGYLAFTRASQFLWVSRPTSIVGREAAPSRFWDRLRGLFPKLPIHLAPDPGHVHADAIATPRQLITGVMRWAREQAAAEYFSSPGIPGEGRGGGLPHLERSPLPNPPPEYQGRGYIGDSIWPALYSLLASHPPADDAIDVMRFRAWKALGYDNSARISGATADRLFPQPLAASVTQLESFAACPFQHFVKFGLRLQPRFDRQVGGRELSGAYRDLLNRLIGSAISRVSEGGMRAITSKQVRVEAERLTRHLAQELFTGNGRNAYLLRTIEREMLRIVAAQQAAMARGEFQPAHVAVTFGHGGRFKPIRITTPRGAKTQVHGRIDRLDVAGENVVAVDYRLRPQALSVEQAYHGLSLRLLAHLLAIDASFPPDEEAEHRAVAALELPLLRSFKPVDDPSEAPGPDDPEFLLAQPPRGLVAIGAASEFDSNWTAGRSDILGANIKKDGTLGLKGILLEEDQLTDLLRFAWRKIGELADEVLAGRIDIHPYRLRNRSPCVQCEFKSVCRFDLGINRYRSLPATDADEIWEKIETGAGDV
jgi:ATP-dependent helicase/nuclease subunit B